MSKEYTCGTIYQMHQLAFFKALKWSIWLAK